MFGVIVRRSLSLQRGAFTDLVFFLVLVLSCRGQELIGPSQPIVALVGDDVTLPCHLKPSSDAFDLTIEWSRPDLEPRYVVVRRYGEEAEYKKHPTFRGRTSVFPEELRHGNISLKLSKVKLSDGGTYNCFIPFLSQTVSAQLDVEHFFIAPTNPSSPGSQHVVISAVIGCAALVLVLVVLLAVWKRRQIRLICTANRSDEDRKSEEEDRETKSKKQRDEERALLMAERDDEKESKNERPKEEKKQETKKKGGSERSEVERREEREETETQEEERPVRGQEDQTEESSRGEEGGDEQQEDQELNTEEREREQPAEPMEEVTGEEESGQRKNMKQTEDREREAESPEEQQSETRKVPKPKPRTKQGNKEQHEQEKKLPVDLQRVRESWGGEKDSEVETNFQNVMKELQTKRNKTGLETKSP